MGVVPALNPQPLTLYPVSHEEESMEGRVRSAYMDIVERRALGDNLYRVTIAANESVRQPPELDFGGLSTENYTKNPVVMWAHDVVGRSPSGGLPIGRTSRLTKGSNGRILADFEFLAEDPFAQRVKNAWDQGFLQAASISWLPLEGAPVDGGRWRDTRSELLEWSIVAVPADPEALKETHRRMMDDYLRAPWNASAANDGDWVDEDTDKLGVSLQADGLVEKDLKEIGELVVAARLALTNMSSLPAHSTSPLRQSSVQASTSLRTGSGQARPP